MESARPSMRFLTLLHTAASQAHSLLALESRMFAAEMKQKGADIAVSFAWLGFAVVLVVLGAIVIIQGTVALLIYLGVGPVLAPFLVGAVLLFLAAGALGLAWARLRDWTPLPVNTFNQIRKDVRIVDESIRNAAR